MSKDNTGAGTLKKLLSVKEGGAEFFRLTVKVAVWLFALGAVFYGLVWAPNESLYLAEQQLLLGMQKANIEAESIRRQCQASATNNLNMAMQSAKQQEQEVSEEDQKKMYDNGYVSCLYLNALYTPEQQAAGTN